MTDLIPIGEDLSNLEFRTPEPWNGYWKGIHASTGPTARKGCIAIRTTWTKNRRAVVDEVLHLAGEICRQLRGHDFKISQRAVGVYDVVILADRATFFLEDEEPRRDTRQLPERKEAEEIGPHSQP